MQQPLDIRDGRSSVSPTRSLSLPASLSQLCAPVVLQNLRWLLSAPRLRPVALRLMTALWKTQVDSVTGWCAFLLWLLLWLLLLHSCLWLLAGSSLPGAAASAGPARLHRHDGQGGAVGENGGGGRLPPRHLQREVTMFLLLFPVGLFFINIQYGSQ